MKPTFWMCSLVFVAMSALGAGLARSQPTWLDDGWPYRIELTIKPEHLAFGLLLNDFTLLVKADSGNLADVLLQAKPDGSDIVMTAGDGTTVLGHEIVSFDPVAQAAEIWFKADEISSSSDRFYLYYGNPDTTITQTPTAAWTDQHIAVYHFADDPSGGILSDSGPHDGFGVGGPGSGWSSSDVTAGQIGQAWHFNGSTHWVYSDHVTSPDSSFTFSAWFANDTNSDTGMLAFQSRTGYWDLSFRRTQGDPNGDIRTYTGEMYWFPNILDTGLHHYAWRLDAVSDTARFFFDGVEQSIKVRIPINQPSRVYEGKPILERVGIAGPVSLNVLDITKGIVDEFHIVEGVKSPEWIATEYQDQSDPFGFFTFLKQDRDSMTAVDVDSLIGSTSGLGRISVWPNPFWGVAQINVEAGGANVQVQVYDVAGRLVRTLSKRGSGDEVLRLRWDGRDTQGRSVGSGTYFIRAVSENSTARGKVLLLR